ncbi:DUF3822 family protein [Ferruginibacter sp. SUN002]|uniref:DUF3822 family protein n=1 Tax=Ferruginibacter sp. SUN002 TaxID=2937789 RepID=UPI003D35AA40
MTPLFSISGSFINYTAARLFIEVGECSLSFFILNEANEFIAVSVFQFTDKLQAEKEIQHILYHEAVLKERYRRVDIIYVFSESILAPKALTDIATNKEMLELVYGDFADKAIRSDFMYKQNVQNIYRIPTVIDNAVSNQFPTATITHLYSVLPDVVSNKENVLYTIFSPKLIIAILVKDGKLQIVQNFRYQTAEDAAYYLLSICNNFEADINQTNLILTGMIDVSSPLYAELYKYFLNTSFGTLPDQFQYSDEIKNYPAHYFSHLFSIAACV